MRTCSECQWSIGLIEHMWYSAIIEMWLMEKERSNRDALGYKRWIIPLHATSCLLSTHFFSRFCQAINKAKQSNASEKKAFGANELWTAHSQNSLLFVQNGKNQQRQLSNKNNNKKTSHPQTLRLATGHNFRLNGSASYRTHASHLS